MSNESLLLLVLIVLVLGALPAWPYSSSWGYGPTGAVSIVLVVVLICALQGRPLFYRNTGEDVKDAVTDTGHDLRSAGRDTADSIRRTLQ